MGVASFDHTRASSFCNSCALKLRQGIGLFSPSCVCLPARLPLLPPLPLQFSLPPAPLTVLTTTKAGNMRQPVAAGRKAKAPSRSCCKSRTSEHSIPAIPRTPLLSYPLSHAPSPGAYAAAPVLQSMSTFVLAAGAPAPASAPYPTPFSVPASVLGLCLSLI